MSKSVRLHRLMSVMVFGACFALASSQLSAQMRLPSLTPPANHFNLQSNQSGSGPSGTSAFLVEAGGAVVGSALGFGVLYLTAGDCAVDDLGCTLEKVFVGIALGTAGAAAGAIIAGRSYDTDPSALGAGLGAIAGAAGGIGLWHLFTEELDVGNHSGSAAIIFVGTQAVATALGSRLVRACGEGRHRAKPKPTAAP